MKLVRNLMAGCTLAVAAACSGGGQETSPEVIQSRDTMAVRGADWLAAQQHDDGTFGLFQPDLGITTLAATALHKTDAKRYSKQVDKALKLVLSRQNAGGKDKGAFADKDGKYLNYKTCVAIMFLHEIDASKYEDQIRQGQRYIKGLQFLDAQEKRDFGAIGYGSKIRADLSNTQFALEALAKTGVDPSDPVFKRAELYLTRLQNFSESGDIKVWDGGFPYGFRDNGKSVPIDAKDPAGKSRYQSYGGMTYAGLKSMIYARMDNRDPRVVAAMNWITKNYTLEENPGLAPMNEPAKGQQGLYYYYHTFAKTMALADAEGYTFPDGRAINWQQDLLEAAGSRQKDSGCWVNEGHKRWWEADSHLSTSYVLLALAEIR